ncbi:class I SAM-dependent methyltransferase [Neisseria animalis]|uniref:Methyltransferase domain-containing protein n=1 Tax=Neisseria animalis TaxID=492 RepID=A0A5P3MSC4_NEIAN|nr:class I SAM-dependent methyltransferase [Neisseria animalis]QEY24502.1 methyltransferase domain-containing protein [Neisseria animalis]ROW33079.1 methyltransferase domain-containing protein [Neisseria animalis]VEE07208.1 putative rRNA methylase [Neisseria animalis]
MSPNQTLHNIIPFAHYLLQQRLSHGSRVLDGTAGNGNDTLLLAQSVGHEGRVWAFDVQEQALANTKGRLQNAGLDGRVELVKSSHANLADYVCEPLDAAVFNFGWLPGSDKSLTTQAASSIAALSAALTLLKPQGLLLAVLYPGHEAGQEEAAAVENWACGLPQQQYAVLKYGFVNRRNKPPYLLAVEKLRQK